MRSGQRIRNSLPRPHKHKTPPRQDGSWLGGVVVFMMSVKRMIRRPYIQVPAPDWRLPVSDVGNDPTGVRITTLGGLHSGRRT
jgi:hypothetical protein